MTLEPCPICQTEAHFEPQHYPTQPFGVRCHGFLCGMRGPGDDENGSKWNRLSLDARLGKMVREKRLEIIVICDTWGLPIGSEDIYGWESEWKENEVCIQKNYKNPSISYDDAIKDAWATMYKKER